MEGRKRINNVPPERGALQINFMKTLKLKKYKTNSNGNLRVTTDDLALRPDKLIQYYSFKKNDKVGTVVVTEGGEHYCCNNFNDVAKQVLKCTCK